LAAALQNKLKLSPGDCFAILSPNSPEYPLLLLAAAEAGLVASTINPLYSSGTYYMAIDNEHPLWPT